MLSRLCVAAASVLVSVTAVSAADITVGFVTSLSGPGASIGKLHQGALNQRMQIAAALCIAALATPGLSAAQSQATWASSYTDGVVTATETDDHGRVTATITCRPPDGVIVVSDFTLAGAGRRARTSAIGIGNIFSSLVSSVARSSQGVSLNVGALGSFKMTDVREIL